MEVEFRIDGKTVNISALSEKDFPSLKRSKGKSLLETPSNYVVIDIETTGLDPYFDEIVEIAAIKVENNQVQETFQTLVKPNKKIDDFISELTGITNEMVEDAPKIQTALLQFLEFLGDAIILGHNVHFDINFLYDNTKLYFEKDLANDFVDTLRLSRRFFRDVENHKLITLANYFKLSTDGYHRALTDCYITLDLYNKIREYIIIENIDLAKRTKMARGGIIIGDITPTVDAFDENHHLFSKNICFTGKLESMHRREAMQVIVNLGATPQNSVTRKTNFLILGNLEYSKHSVPDGKSSKLKKAENLILSGQDLEIISENVFLDIISTVE